MHVFFLFFLWVLSGLLIMSKSFYALFVRSHITAAMSVRTSLEYVCLLLLASHYHLRRSGEHWLMFEFTEQ